ncbi:MAG TPA: GtrA family protein [Candidatus Paceibacterota bacterium]|nr:GtrA family protein [Candidatus Paceibacterota bacterium]
MTLSALWKNRRERLLVALLLAGMLLVQMVSVSYLTYVSSHNPGVPSYPVIRGDSRDYTQLANNLLQHHVFSDTPDLAPQRIWAPGYAWLLAGSQVLFHSYWPLVVLQMLLSLGSGVLLYLMSRRFLSPTFSAIVVLLYGIDPLVVFAYSSVMTDGIFSFLLLAIIYLLFFRERRELWVWALVGLLLGAATMMRPIGQFLVVLLPAAYLLQRWLQPKAQRVKEHILGGLLVCAVCVALVLVPWMVRNYEIFGSFEVAHTGPNDVLHNDVKYFLAWKDMHTMSPASVFYPARHPDAPQLIDAVQQIAGEQAQLTPPGKDPENADTATIVHFVLADPFSYLYFDSINTIPFFLAGSGSAYVQIIHQERDNTDFSASTLNDAQAAFSQLRAHDYSALATLAPIVLESLFLLFVCVFALVGLYLERKRFEAWLFAGLIAYFALLTGPMAMARYRIPTWPFLLMLAACGCSGLYAHLLRRHGARLAASSKIIRFLISGTIGFAINFFLYSFLVLHLGVWYIAASFISFATSVLAGFFLQKFFTFRDYAHGGQKKQFVWYVGSSIFNMCANAVLLYLLVEHAHVGRIIALVISSALISLWSFFFYQKVIFAKPRQ